MVIINHLHVLLFTSNIVVAAARNTSSVVWQRFIFSENRYQKLDMENKKI